MCLACTQDGSNIAVGGSEGMLEIKKRSLGDKMEEEDEEDKEEDYIPSFLKENPYL